MSTSHKAVRWEKNDVADLARFGGTPSFAEPLHVGRPNIGDRSSFEQKVNDVLDRRWLTNDGPFVRNFERRIADYAGVKECVAMCNATVALEIAIRALNLRGEVIVPSFTFVATPNALQWLGITPVFCDVDPQTHNLDPNAIAEAITPQTTGILAVHVWGRACAIEPLNEIADRRGLKLLFDAAHAFGCTHKGKMIGGFGHAEVFSFHATKFLNSLEGGAVVTNDEELANKIRLMRNFGFTGYDRTEYIGVNGKMNEISAAMGLTNLESIGELISINRRNYEQYRDELNNLPGIELIDYDSREQHNYQYIVVEIDERETVITRDELLEILTAENVLARRYFFPGCHRMAPYKFTHLGAAGRLPQTERLVERVLILPTGQAVTSEDVSRVCAIIRFVLARNVRIKEMLRSIDQPHVV